MEAIYYRDRERITKKTLNEIKKFFSLSGYNWIEMVNVNDEFNCHPKLEPLFHAIQNNRDLNERSQALQQRIQEKSPKLTLSSSYYTQFVEENLLFKLLNDANLQLQKDGEGMVNTYECLSDFYIYYGLYDLAWDSALQKDLRDARRNTANIERPEKFYDFVDVHSGTKQPYSNDQTSTYKTYQVATKDEKFWRMGKQERSLYDKFPYLGKLYDAHDGYMQIYVYDLHHRNWSVNNVIHELVTNGLVKLRHKLNKKELEWVNRKQLM